jgi:hypothetical protein
MNSRMHKMSLGLALLALCLVLAPRAHADPVGSNSLLQSSVMVSGSNSSLYSMNVSGPGVLTVQLENIAWPERLSHLDCSIYSNNGFLQALQDTAQWQFEVTGPASFYASIIAGAGGQLNLGLFSIKVTFQSAAAVVPVPAAVWLLGSVLGLFGVRRLWPSMRFAFGGERFA